ncbi:MAG: hypothetical protein QXW35_05705 [Candidatus Aenigmatarchaeota archaeon]
MVVEKEMIDEKDLASAFWSGMRNNKKIWKIVKDQDDKYLILYSKFQNSTSVELDTKLNLKSIFHSILSLNLKTLILQVNVQKILFTEDEYKVLFDLFNSLNHNLDNFVISDISIEPASTINNFLTLNLVITFRDGKTYTVPFFRSFYLHLNNVDLSLYEIKRTIRLYELDHQQQILEELNNI